MKEMVGGCCVCSDERGWPENPLVYCDGQNCTVAVHQACYGIVTVPTGPWYCRKCESQERPARVRCELCPSRDGALKRTDNQGWAHVVCALYIPEVRFGNVSTMEPIILQLIPSERYSKICYICADAGKASKSTSGACMQCNKSGCRQQFHVTCAQQHGLLCEEAGNYLDNVKYCGYCQHHYSKLKKGGNVKPIPPYKPIHHDTNSSDSPSSPEKEDGHSQKASIRPPEPPGATSNSSSSSSSSSKQKKSSSSGGGSNKNSNSNAPIPYSSSSNATNAVNVPSSGGGGGSSSTRTSSSSSSKEKEKEKDKESKHSSSSSKSVNKVSSSTNNKDQSYSSSSYSTGSSRDKNKSSSSSSKNSSSQNSSNKEEGASSNSHSSKNSSQFSSSSTPTTIRITTTSATATSPVSTIIQKHESGSNSANSSSKENNSVQSGSSTSQAQSDDKSWHHSSNNSKSASSYTASADAPNNDNDAAKTNYNAMTKKRKAMHQANSSNRNSTEESTSSKDVCKDLSIKITPLDKADPSVSEFERHYKKARTDVNPQTTPAAVITSPPEPNIQNVNPNVIHSTGSAAAATAVNNSSAAATAPVSSPATSPTNNNKSQVIQHSMLGKKERAESLVVSVPLSSASVPGIQLPTNSLSNNLSVSTIVNTHQATATSTTASSSLHQGTLYQHLTNSQVANQRASPHIQQPLGRASPITPTPGHLGSETSVHSANNHSSVLQNMNSSSSSAGSVISSAGFQQHTAEPTTKVSYEKTASTRIQAIQQEETGRRSRSQTQDSKRGKKRNVTESSTPPSPPPSSSSNRTTHSKSSSSHARNHNKSNKSNNKNVKMNIDEHFGDGNTLSINSAGPSVVHSSASTASNNHSSSTHTTSPQTIVKLTPAQTSSGSARTSSPIVNVASMKKFTTRDEPSTSRTPDMPTFTAVNTNAGSTGLKFGYEQQQPTMTATATTPAGLVINTAIHALKESPPSSPGSEVSAKKRRKQMQNSLSSQPSPVGHAAETNKDKEPKTILQNGAIPFPTHHMLGNSINPTGNLAKTMTETLNQEIETHLVNSTDVVTNPNLIGPQYPGRKDSTKSTASSTTTTMSGPASLTSMLSGTGTANGTPQSLEQLLERQWEQGSQFLMEQAQHFDIASLLSCLHQLKIENSRLEDHINSLVTRRDHLLAVNARLAIPLGQQPPSAPVNNGPQTESQPAPPQQQQQPQPPQQQQQPANTNNKRQAPQNPVPTIQISPLENGLDYRGHNQSQIPSQSSNSNSGSNIRHSTTVMKGGSTTHVVTIDTPSSNPQHPPQHQYHVNAQYQQQQVYQQQQQSHVNSVRGRQGNSFQSQSVPNVFPQIPKSKN